MLVMKNAAEPKPLVVGGPGVVLPVGIVPPPGAVDIKPLSLRLDVAGVIDMDVDGDKVTLTPIGVCDAVRLTVTLRYRQLKRFEGEPEPRSVPGEIRDVWTFRVIDEEAT